MSASPPRRALTLLGLAALLAGCAEAPSSPSPAPVPAGRVAFEQPLPLPPCDVLEGFGQMARDAAQAMLPPGFEARLDRQGRTAIAWGLATCGDESRAYFAISVEPTDEALRDERVENHFYEPEHAFTDGLLARALAPALAPEAGMHAELHLGLTDAGARVELPGWVHEAEAPAMAFTPGERHPLLGRVFREWFPAPGGYAYLQAAFDASGGGEAGAGPLVLRTGEGSPAREAFGAEARLTGLGLRGVAYRDAVAGFVPFPPGAGG